MLKKDTGASIPMLCGLVVIGLMVSALAVDVGLNLTIQNSMRTAADSSALAGVLELVNSTATTAGSRQSDALASAVETGDQNVSAEVTQLDENDMIFGYIDPMDVVFDPGTFTTASNSQQLTYTGGYNALLTKVRAQGDNGAKIPTIMANLFGVNQSYNTAYSVALLDSNIGVITDGLRPVYGCTQQFTSAISDGNLSNNVVRMYSDRFLIDGAVINAGCPPPGAGNWGFADFRDDAPGAPGNDTLADWWLNGYSGNNIEADLYYSTQSGNSISSHQVASALEILKNNQTVIMIPLIDEDYSGNGSNTDVHVVGFTGFVVTDYKTNGPATGRYIEGYLTRAVCSNECDGGNEAGWTGTGVVKARLVQ